MPVNLDKPHLWKADVARSVDMYNDWFMHFAPAAFRKTRVATTRDVEGALARTANMTNVRPATLRAYPDILPTLRMCTCPPIAVDRLIGLAGANPRVVVAMDKEKRLPPRMAQAALDAELIKIAATIERMADPDIFVWLNPVRAPRRAEIHRAATIVADRLCGSMANPIIRNAQEQRQLAFIEHWLVARGYRKSVAAPGSRWTDMDASTYSFRTNVSVNLAGTAKTVNIPVDAVIQPHAAAPGDLPLLIEAKSAGDFTNTNKRRKEEVAKVGQLRATYGGAIRFALFLCGYFDSGYLGYGAAEGIDWVWEHRIDDLAMFGL